MSVPLRFVLKYSHQYIDILTNTTVWKSVRFYKKRKINLLYLYCECLFISNTKFSNTQYIGNIAYIGNISYSGNITYGGNVESIVYIW